MAVNTKVWAKDIAGSLFADNQFMAYGLNDNAYVQGGKIVVLTEAGAAGAIEEDPTSFPVTAESREDFEFEYTLNWFTAKPRKITNAESAEVSYDKRQSILLEDKAALIDRVAKRINYNWCPSEAAQIVRTTGDARAAHVAGATGNRKKVTLADFLAAKRILDAQDVPQEERYGLCCAEMYNDLLEIPEIKSSLFAGTTLAQTTGLVGNVYGFKLFMRSSTTSYTNASTPVKRLPTAAALTTANASLLLWGRTMVRRALGEVNFNYNPNDPTYYGPTMSYDVRAGGKTKYNTQKGVVAIVEAASA